MRDDEADAIAALQSGDIAGLRYIVERYQLPALRLAYNLCNDRQMAEDAVAESFLAVARHATSYDPTRPFQSWFYRIVVNGVRTARRRDRQRRVLPDAHDLLKDRPDPGPGPETQALQHELEQALLHRVDRLSQRHREVLILRYYLDMDERTMSNVLGIPIGTVKWRLYQARKKLRQEIECSRQADSRLVEEVQEA